MSRNNADTISPPSTDKSKASLDQEVQNVLSLMMLRRRGEASDEAVEAAVGSMLARSNISAAPQKRPALKQKEKAKKHETIVMDNEMYDDLDADVGPVSQTRVSDTAQDDDKAPSLKSAWQGKTSTVESVRKQIDDSPEDPMDEIPLGKLGARMMIAFGDGRNPKPEAVSATLLGARRCLQMAIKDARALRRQAKSEYLRARAVVKQGKQSLKKSDLELMASNHEEVAPEVLYRAMNGYDRLSYDPRCGFDFQQLQQLFPEEMNAYERWTKMHKSYVESKDTNAISSTSDIQEDPKNNDDGGGEAKKNQARHSPLVEGHLTDRLAQFDTRTEQMKNDWYLKFSEIRRGSFLPTRGKKTVEGKKWDEHRKQNKKRGRQPSSWEALPASMVQFLHWIGFDHRSALPPPNEETTQALGFLAHDFFGRIVEKAIYLRSIKNHDPSDETKLVLELKDGEQLDAEDIERSLNDTTVKPIPLYGSSGNSQVAAQLYFGPGFESRLEMEIDELVSRQQQKKKKKKKVELPEAEKLVREKEDELFERLKEPPVLGGYRSIMEDDNISESHENPSE